jgi:predicted acylesterase/phospholipase RssA
MDANYRQTFSQLATVTIQGGGVFGLSLLGQLRAVEEEGFDVAAYAGSSAGALIATLAWAGYSANDILKEIWALLRDPGLSATLRNAHEAAAEQDRTLARITKLYQDIGNESRLPKWAANLMDARRVLKLVSLVKASEGFQRRGIFDGEGIEAWIDGVLRAKLDPVREQHRLAKVAGPVTFASFFDTFEAICGRRQPLLLVGVTNLSREDFLIIDSHSSAFQHLPVASIVRASISFPAFFRPKELAVIRDRRSGRIADSQTFASGDTYESKELFVDGGVVSNFPAWTIFDLARDTMWGGSSDSKQLRKPPVVTPLRASAYRPMVHLGLQVQRLAPVSNAEHDQRSVGPAQNREIAEEEFLVHSQDEMRRPAGYWRALFELATGGGRAHLENLLIGHGRSARGARTTFLQQNINTSGWQHHPMELNLLTVAKAGEMYDTGRNFARPRLSGLQFGFTRHTLVASRLADAAGLLARQITGLSDDMGSAARPEGSLHLIKGPLGQEELVPVFHYPAMDVDAQEPALPLTTQAEAEPPQLTSLRSRSLVIVWEEAGDGLERITLCAPVLDSREIAGQDLSGLDLDSSAESGEGGASLDDEAGDEDFLEEESDDDDFLASIQRGGRTLSVSANRFYGVIFGILTMQWLLPLGTARRVLENAENPDDLLARTEEIITGLVSPIGEALSSDFGRPTS